MLTHPVVCVLIGTLLGFLSGLGVGGGRKEADVMRYYVAADVHGFCSELHRALDEAVFLQIRPLISWCFSATCSTEKEAVKIEYRIGMPDCRF